MEGERNHFLEKKKKQQQGRGKNKTGGLEEALWRSDA